MHSVDCLVGLVEEGTIGPQTSSVQAGVLLTHSHPDAGVAG